MKKLLCLFLFVITQCYGNDNLEKALMEGNPFNIANAYFELEQYPWAVLYYARALKNNPQNELAQNYLNLALSQLPGPKTSPFTETPGHMFLWFLIILILSLLTWSLAYWLQNKRLTVAFYIMALTALSFLSYATVVQYFTPIPAIVVESSALYRGMGDSYGYVGTHPIFAGSAIDVIDIHEAGRWLKVKTKEGTIGYLPLKSLRII